MSLRCTALLIALAGCSSPPTEPPLPRELAPVPDPFGPDDPAWSPQPRRERPSAVVAAGDRLYVALTGTEQEPGREVAVVDAATLETVRRIGVGPSPCALGLHPGGRFLVVLNRFARYASVIDTRKDRVVDEIDTLYYTEDIAFDAAGERAYLVNRWKDSVLRWRVRVSGDRFEVDVIDRAASRDGPVGLPAPLNPDRVLVLPDGNLIVGSETDLGAVVLDPEDGRVIARYRPNSPVTDLVLHGELAFALQLGSGSGHPPDDGFDGDADGAPGDGTANVIFQDFQNEIDVLRSADLSLVHRYTSDTICCRDFRDVDPERPEAGQELPMPDTWPPGRAAYLPPRSTWIVAGATPERAVLVRREDGAAALAVVFGGSSELQTFDIAADGALSPRETAATGLYPTGFGAFDAVATGDGTRVVVVDRLGETLTAIDLRRGPADDVQRVPVGDVAGGAFPATDAELGEAFNTVTAPFTVDGDQSCVECHRDGTPIGKPVSMPLLSSPAWGVRNVMSYRSAYDTRPWFVETAMDDQNFFAVINEFSRRENFCCEGTDPRIWPRYPGREACLADPTLDGCQHVLDCVAGPPPECAERRYGSLALTRDQHFRQAALRVLGRSESFGDALYVERIGPEGEVVRRPIPLGFDAITRALGLFLLSRARTLPNPNAAMPSVRALRGAELFRSSATGCISCHPLPIGATARPTVATEAPGPLSFPYLVSPMRDPHGADVDRITAGFIGTFPTARQTDQGLRVGVTSIRGIWDRPRFLHHGQARSLREVLATPGHPALAPGERGMNERNGQPDTHGGTSHLTADELADLIAFIETL